MKKKYTSIGGQALIEGIMMRGSKEIAIAVRKPDGEIVLKEDPIKPLPQNSILKWPIVRGSVALISSMIVGIKALTYSAEFFEMEGEAEKESKFEKWLYEKLGDKTDNVLVIFSMVLAMLFAFGLFGVLPTVITNFFKTVVHNRWGLAALEGLMKIVLFLTYVIAISHMKDVRRVFEYHGAEHKTIHCFEAGEALTVENIRKHSRLHPRCGTSFILFVLVISIMIFSLISWQSIAMRVGLKLVLLPVVAGLSYELLKVAGKSDGRIIKALSYPGLQLQKLTTKEPDDKQIEVAIAAMVAVLATEPSEAHQYETVTEVVANEAH
ncbi:MAG: DUF1385 domain-containing protein [Clostridia bacterium]|nr:DUF1385 domain-containing protein [Clostridia bacterium]